LAQNEDDKQQEERSRLDRPTIFDVAQEMQAEEAERKQAFLVSFSESGHLGRACRDAHVTRTQFTAWLERDPAFKEMYDDIYEEQADDTEKALLELIKDDGTRQRPAWGPSSFTWKLAVARCTSAATILPGLWPPGSIFTWVPSRPLSNPPCRSLPP
jgi:hypothetical protein